MPRTRSGLMLVVAALAMLPASASAKEKVPLIYEPVANTITRCYFANGEPFAIVTTDSAVVMLAMDPAMLGGWYDYVRVWCLYYSTASEPVLIEPSKMATLITTKIATKIGKADSTILSPEPPSRILKHISNESANKEILQVIGGVLAAAGQSMSVRATSIQGGGNAAGSSWTLNDSEEKRRALMNESGQRTANAIERTRSAYDLFSSSVSAGILRRNTVFPGGSVNGYIYFPFMKSSKHFRDYGHHLLLRLAQGDIRVEFKPAAGE